MCGQASSNRLTAALPKIRTVFLWMAAELIIYAGAALLSLLAAVCACTVLLLQHPTEFGRMASSIALGPFSINFPSTFPST